MFRTRYRSQSRWTLEETKQAIRSTYNLVDYKSAQGFLRGCPEQYLPALLCEFSECKSMVRIIETRLKGETKGTTTATC